MTLDCHDTPVNLYPFAAPSAWLSVRWPAAGNRSQPSTAEGEPPKPDHRVLSSTRGLSADV